jgi:hypothetical protein
MQNFRFVTQLDTFPLMGTLQKLKPREWKPVAARGELNLPMYGMGASLLLRGHRNITKENWLDDLPVEELPDLEKWETMKRLLKRAQTAIMAEPVAQQVLTGDMGRAMISRLDPGSTIFWHDDNGAYHDSHARFHVPLVTNPLCLMYSGPEVLHMEVGSLWYFNNRARHSAANWGQHMRLHLILEMRKRQAPVEPLDD